MAKKNRNDGLIPKSLRMSGGFDVSDRELAEWELSETMLKLAGKWTPVEDRPESMSRQDAELKLNSTLSGKAVQQTAPTEKMTMKFDESPKPKSKKEAERQLRRTQELLRVKQNAAPAPSIATYPKRDATNTRREDLLAAIKRLLDRKDELTVADIAKALNIDAKYAMELCRELEKAGLADLS